MRRAVAARLAVGLAALALLAGCGQPARKAEAPSDWERKNERFLKGEVDAQLPEPPAYPRDEDLVRFYVTAASDNRYFVDRRSLSIRDSLVHYTLVVRTSSGVDNVFFEALNCKEGRYRNYARGTAGNKWIVRPTEWREYNSGRNIAQYTLHWEYFCPNNQAVASTAEGVNALERGGHPWSKKTDGTPGVGAR